MWILCNDMVGRRWIGDSFRDCGGQAMALGELGELIDLCWHLGREAVNLVIVS